VCSSDLGDVYGVIALAQSGNNDGTSPNSAFVIGIESEVTDFNAAAPAPRSFTPSSFAANYLSTDRFGNTIDAAYLVNPYNAIPVQTGFMIPAAAPVTATYSRTTTLVTVTKTKHGLKTGIFILVASAADSGLVTGSYVTITVTGDNTFTFTTASTGTSSGAIVYSAKSVNSVAFGCHHSGLTYGLDLATGSYSFAAISIPNNTPVRAYNAAKTTELNVLFTSTSNQLVLGTDAVSTQISSPAGGALFNTVGANTSGWYVGSGNPNSNVVALIGSLYTNTAGGAGNTLWVKESGAATNTGWVAK
jgi:hypothetical protein